MKKLIIIVLCSLLLGGCQSTGDEIRAAIKVCENNGGLNVYLTNHTAICKNGAKFEDPLSSIK